MNREHVGRDLESAADEARDIVAGDPRAATGDSGDQGALESILGRLEVGGAWEEANRAGWAEGRVTRHDGRSARGSFTAITPNYCQPNIMHQTPRDATHATKSCVEHHLKKKKNHV